MKYFLAFTFFCLIGLGIVNGQQQSGAQIMRLAQSIYEQGRLHELPDLINKNLETFSKADKVSAYRLLTLAYIYLEEPEKADESLLKLIQTDPYFKPNPGVDPAEFIGLYNTFRTNEIYRLGIKLGANMTQPNLVSSNSVSQGNSKYKRGFGFTASLSLEIPVKKKLTVNPDLQIQFMNFSSTSTSTQSTGQFVTAGTQKISYVALPIVVHYQIMDNKFKPYILAGFSPDYLIASTLTLRESRAGFQPVESKPINVLSSQSKFNLSGILGAGMRIRLAGGYFLTELRFKYGFSKIPTVNGTYSNSSQIFDYKFADGIYKLTAASLSVGYVQNFFNPKKKKIKRK